MVKRNKVFFILRKTLNSLVLKNGRKGEWKEKMEWKKRYGKEKKGGEGRKKKGWGWVKR